MMLVGLIKYYEGSVKRGENNLWTAGDIVVVCASPNTCSNLITWLGSVTHAVTLIALCPYFRNYPRLAAFKVTLMWLIYGQWLVVAASILNPDKPEESKKLDQRLANFWHAATWIGIFSVA